MSRHFVRHYLEILVAMSLGMLVLGAARAGVMALVGIDNWTARNPELALLAMAFDMSVGMLGWMRYRGHGWAATLEMVGAMFAPILVLAPLSGLNVISTDQLMIATHVVMLPLMLVVMLRRREEYTR